MADQRVLHLGVHRGAAAEGQHSPVLAERLQDHRPLDLAEVRLAGVDEDVRNHPALAALDDRVGVVKGDIEQRGQPSPNSRLAGPRRSDEDGDRGHHERISAGMAAR